MTRHLPVIILVAPQMGENIGSVARVMSNFGFEELRIVAPRDGWPNSKAIDMAANGSFVLEKARIFDGLNEAITDLSYLVATTAQSRYMVKPVYNAIDTANLCLQRPKDKIGVMFGRERSGLTNEELSFADCIISLQTSLKNPSLNLAMAVGIICYELSQIKLAKKQNELMKLASKADIEFFLTTLENMLTIKSFFKSLKMKPTMVRNIRNMFLRRELTEQDVKTMVGIINCLNN